MRLRTIKTFSAAAAEFRRGASVSPLIREIPGDLLTPVGAFMRLAKPSEEAFLLESVEGGERSSRYSILGARPFETIEIHPDGTRIRSASGVERLPGNPFLAAGAALRRRRALPDAGLPPFAGGAVGSLHYEAARYLEPTLGPAPEGCSGRFHVFADVAVFDHVRRSILLIANALGPSRKEYGRAVDSLDRMAARLASPSPALPRRMNGRPQAAAPKSALGARAFLAGVKRLKREIRRGEIFQAVLSDSFEIPFSARPFDAYRSLRALNPAPYLFYLGKDDDAFLGASPETLVRVQNGMLETHPIAGTRPRGHDETSDLKFERQLLASVKEKAEHAMLVDLGRNDLGRVAAPGSVHVAEFMKVERYSHVMHLVSKVRAKLARGKTAWDALGACFPAGTVSGAPKIRAMQLLSEIEPAPRGRYAGAVVYHDFQGNLDSAISIRCLSAAGKPGRRVARTQAGAGIVADSRPAAELREIRAKAAAALAALRAAEGSAP